MAKMSKQIENDTRERKHKKEENRNSRVKCYRHWIKNSQDEFNSRFEMAEESVTLKIEQ